MAISRERFDDADRIVAELQRRDAWGKAICPICESDCVCWEGLRSHLKDQEVRNFPITKEMTPQHGDGELDICLRELGIDQQTEPMLSPEVAAETEARVEADAIVTRRGPGRPRKAETVSA